MCLCILVCLVLGSWLCGWLVMGYVVVFLYDFVEFVVEVCGVFGVFDGEEFFYVGVF